MSKVAVVYWSSTGNTEAMANAVAEGAKAAGAEVVTLRQNFPAKRLDFSDLMDGAMENGCITGKINAKKTGLFLSLTV